MKIAICGKGGSGKSSLTAVLAGQLAKTGLQVLIIDADESNTGLYRLLDMSPPVNLLDEQGGKAAFKKKLNQTFPPPAETLFQDHLTPGMLPESCVSEKNGLRLVSTGKIHHAGEGCACALGVLSKMLLSKLELAENEVVLIDLEAGVEHFGRGLDNNCDLILCVVDPGYESFLLAEKVAGLVRDMSAELYYILNRSDDRSAEVALQHLDPERVIARIPYNDTLFSASLTGSPVTTEIPEIEPAARMIRNKLSRSRT